MPEALNFTSLKEDLRGYIERGSVNDGTVYDQIPRLINQAERAIATKLKIQGFINVVVGELTVGTSVYPKPDRWRSTVSMNYGTGDDNNDRLPLWARSYEYCRKYWPNSDVTGTPKYYADYQYTHWLIAPTPQATYPWEIVYYEMPALLDDSNETNWLTDFSPNLLLYRSLLEIAPFLGSDDRIQTWRDFYNEQIESITEQDVKKIVDRNSTRQGA